MQQKKIRFLFFSVLVLATFFFVIKVNVLPGLKSGVPKSQDYKILGTAISLIKSNYVEAPKAVQTLEGGFKGMIDSLDVLSCYFNRSQLEKYRRMRGNPYAEPGIILYKKFGSFPQVIGVREKSPADIAGIKYGDIISALEGMPTHILSMREVNLMLKNIEKKPLLLKILRPGGAKEIEVSRQVFNEKNFSYKTLKNTSGILSFNNLFLSVDKIKEEVLPGIKSLNLPLILDFRNCHEGSAFEASRLINLFYKSEKIGYFSGKKGNIESLSCPSEPVLPAIPLIIWVNRATFGSAEIVASVLQKTRRAQVVGIETLGLVSNQRIFLFKDNSGLLLTTEIFNLDTNQTLWNKGIEPDTKISPKDLAFDAYMKATRVLLSKSS